jgi:hypothetical protein
VKRDVYRSRVLNAESELPTRRLSGMDVTHLRDRILKSAWWQKNARPYKKLVGQHYFPTDNGEFAVPCARFDDAGTLLFGVGSPELRLIHAIAHHLVDYTVPDTGIHGPEFAKAYLMATRRWLGQETRDQLAVAFAKHQVKTRTWSPEARTAAKHRAALRDLKAMREELTK